LRQTGRFTPGSQEHEASSATAWPISSGSGHSQTGETPEAKYGIGGIMDTEIRRSPYPAADDAADEGIVWQIAGSAGGDWE